MKAHASGAPQARGRGERGIWRGDRRPAKVQWTSGQQYEQEQQQLGGVRFPSTTEKDRLTLTALV